MATHPVPGYAAVLFDVVGSRGHDDRGALQAVLDRAAIAVNQTIEALDPITATVGDELQATYPDPTTAVRAAVHLRLELIGDVDLRVGIGWGPIAIHDPTRTPFGQDGPAWWAARRALDDVAASTARSGYEANMGLSIEAEYLAGSPRPCTVRGAGPLPPPLPLRIDGVMLLRSQLALLDQALARLDATEAAIVRADLHGEDTRTIASRLGLSPSAISQRRSRNHLRELVVALDLMGEIR